MVAWPLRSRKGTRLVPTVSVVAALLANVSCGSGGGVLPPPHLSCGAGSAVASTVVMMCGNTSGATERVDVVLSGPASGTVSVRGFNFDVTYDPMKVEFVPAAPYASPLFPAGLIAVTLFNGNQGRLLVSVQQPGGLDAAAVGPGQSTILSLSFGRKGGATFGPTPLQFENAEATGASASIGFTSDITLAYQ